jgi:DNA-binding response OmpR family regulator
MTSHILIADADPYLAETYRDHLAELGFVAHTATDAVTCVDSLRQHRPDLLLLSTSLPWGGCDGVLAVMREDVGLRPEFVIILASPSEQGVLYRVALSHIDDYWFKPLSPARLEQCIKNLLRQRVDPAIIEAGD